MLALLLKAKLRLQRLLELSEAPAMLPWAAVVGFVGALATIIFRDALRGLQWLFLGRSGSFVEIAEALPWQARVVLPALGGILAGIFLVAAKRRTSGGTSDYMESIALGEGHVSVSQTILRSLSSLCTIASGGSIGREGSMVQLAALSASLTGRVTHLDPSRLRLLVACGAAAGITAAYNAPIASAFFITEIVLGVIAMDSLGPVMVASVVANITMRKFPGYQPTYEMPVFPPIANLEVLLFVALGLLAGFFAPQFLRLLDLVKRKFQKADFPLPVRLALGGLIVGIISVWVPQVWGNGYSVVNSLLHTHWAWQAVLLVLVFKIIATAATVGSGAVGGIFTPTLFVGAAFGFLFGQGMHELWPHAVSAPFTYAMVGMGAFLAAATSAPLMAILMIFEMTLSYQVMLPLMLSCVVSYFIARSIGGTTMYEITSRREEAERARLRLRATRMQDFIKPAQTVLPLDAPLQDLTRLFLQYPVKYVYIVDDANRYQGVVALQDLATILPDADAAGSRKAKDFLRSEFLAVITPDMSLSDALQRFLTHQGERLPVVRDLKDPVLLGVVYKTSLLDTYFRLNR
ncbi:MAG TPA: ClcB-like voltage-gated chloride channel protein [Noviherbaspirillum sp.]|uniref:ClcB-like voltage-gated chloride channel protein n=1 Tax=Noviherbaspirillum sp. TaxID=1926288 RepID=UPI002B48D7B0|nr:ClcB-like voltage-gated chloride channel protein [Noviherbaspirillum sp.]HJV88319.1 ClcB-like voltage-gated chloride channel protein [Noviherbaspirillum sp.]